MSSKRKVLSLALVAIVCAIAIVAGSLAFFTDTDSKKNVFVFGNVDISTYEKQRDDEGKLVDYDQSEPKVLMPIIGTVPDLSSTDDLVDSQSVENYVDKIVYTKNEGEYDAYVRTFIAVPKTLVEPGKEILHFDSNVSKWNFDSYKTYDTTIDGVTYAVYVATYPEAIKKGDSTDYVLKGVYLDKAAGVVATSSGTDVLAYMGASGAEYVSTFPATEKVNVYVATQAVQADGFADAATALNSAFGAPSATNLPTFE